MSAASDDHSWTHSQDEDEDDGSAADSSEAEEAAPEAAEPEPAATEGTGSIIPQKPASISIIGARFAFLSREHTCPTLHACAW